MCIGLQSSLEGTGVAISSSGPFENLWDGWGGGGAFWTIPKTLVIKPWGEVTGVGEGAGRVPKNLFIRRLQPYVYMGPFLRTGPSF